MDDVATVDKIPDRGYGDAHAALGLELIGDSLSVMSALCSTRKKPRLHPVSTLQAVMGQ
jgi:hypothetical protein